ncbi:Afadin and alpha-actinin-binding-domain-containing protein [Coniochaeta sp. 2T2.1]|nr:Afadin and alpha-actinin-binding-domain-containing protein [Coniochaeta sp. 2T2.1]
MIDLDNLRTASLYINNQLLSRGLLRDGEKINFVHPGDSDSQLADTMGKIMGVVNDLILRRDRDADHRESLSTTLRALRAESLRLTNDIQQLRDKQAEAQRKASLAEAAETSMRAQLKSAEATIHKLKDEAARMKTLVAQTRAACANEVRKRDRQIDGLKKAVSDTGRTRGATKNPGITTINVTGEIGGEGGEKGTPRGVTESEAYDLRMETNSFLAELAKCLSAENETLLELVRRTTQSLKEMSGWDKEDGAQGVGSDGHAHALPVNPDEMAHDIEDILEHLRSILTNPSFVPIEEVVMREEEISRLRDGWEKMETRWAEAVHLMDGWRRRMQADGRPVNVEELKMGLRLSPVRIRDVAETANSLGLRLAAVREETEERSMMQSPSPADSLHLVPAPEYEDELEASDAESSIFEDDVDINELDVEEPNVEVLQQSVMFSSSPLPSPPQLSPLKDSYSAGNRGQEEPISFKSRKGLGDFTTIVEENTRDLAQETQAPEPPPLRTQPQSPTRKPVPRSRPTSRAETPPTSVDMSDIKSTPDSNIFMKASKEETSAKKPPPAATTRQRTTTAPAARPSRPQAAPSTTRTATRPAPPRPTTTRTTRPQPSSQASSQPQPPPQSRPQPSPQTHPTESSPTAPPPPPSNTRKDRTTSAQSTTSTTSSLSTTSSSRSPTKSGSSRLPLPRTNNLLPQPQQSPLTMATIAAKLAASEREADAARVRAKLKAARLARMGRKETVLAPPTQDGNAEGEGDEQKEPVKRDRQAEGGEGREAREEREESARTETESAGRRARREETERDADEVDMIPVEKPRKRERRTSKAASRRRSTLNPFELQSLIQGNVVDGV